MRGLACWTLGLCVATSIGIAGCGSDAQGENDGASEPEGSSGSAGDVFGGSGAGGGVAITMMGSSGGGAAGRGGATVGAPGGHGGAGGAGGSSAGASGSAGSQVGAGGSGGGSPHVVGKCDGLGAVGQFEKITPPNIKLSPPYTGTIMVLADPQASGTIYTTTSQSGVFRSTDCGATWTKMNTGRHAQDLDSGAIWSAVIDPDEPKTLYALTGYGASGLWKTTNGGTDWDPALPTMSGVPGFVARVTIDPTNHLHLIVNFHDNCSAGHTPVCMAETKDGGSTWKVIDFPTSIKDGWGEGTAVMPLDEKRWIFEFWELYYTSDAGTTWTKTSDGAAVQGSFFRAANGSYYLGAQNGMLTSPDGASWSRIPSSGSGFDAVIGDGTRLFGFDGFQPPSGPNVAWSAPYNDPTRWSALATPGFSNKPSSGFTSLDYDADHALLYAAAQGEGLWRMVTK
jgi:hypothetical protein